MFHKGISAEQKIENTEVKMIGFIQHNYDSTKSMNQKKTN